MSMGEALRLPLTADLRPLLDLLARLGVASRVSEESGEQVLWVPQPLVDQVRELYARQQAGELPVLSVEPAPIEAGPGRWRQAVRQAPLTLVMLLICLVVAAITLMGTHLPTVRWFTLLDFRVEGQYLVFSTLSESLAGGQWWRLFSSMFLHFWIPGLGPLHLLMNGLWYWELGRRIEGRQGALMLLALSLLFSLAASLSQHFFGGIGIAGGLSGVLYGLLGHCWLFQKLAPNPGYRLPPGLVGLMLVWLLLCLSGVFAALVSIANAAHVGGLVAGCITGVIGGLLARRRQSR